MKIRTFGSIRRALPNPHSSWRKEPDRKAIKRRIISSSTETLAARRSPKGPSDVRGKGNVGIPGSGPEPEAAVGFLELAQARGLSGQPFLERNSIHPFGGETFPDTIRCRQP